MDYKNICFEVVKLSKSVALFIKEQKEAIKSADIETKGLHNYVTYVDKGAEEMIVDGLRKIIPDSGFITEEGTADKNKEDYIWIIDPLDGTTNFIHGLPPFAISIALQYKGETVVGVVREVVLDECFYSYHGGKAYLNETEIKVSNIKKVNDSLIATGFPYYDYNRLNPFMKTLEYFMKNSHGIRRLGSAATDLIYVACGRLDAFYEYGLSPWDVAAGAFIVEQAGGKVSDFSGKENYIFGKEVIATNGNIFEEFQKAISDIMS